MLQFLEMLFQSIWYDNLQSPEGDGEGEGNLGVFDPCVASGYAKVWRPAVLVVAMVLTRLKTFPLKFELGTPASILVDVDMLRRTSVTIDKDGLGRCSITYFLIGTQPLNIISMMEKVV